MRILYRRGLVMVCFTVQSFYAALVPVSAEPLPQNQQSRKKAETLENKKQPRIAIKSKRQSALWGEKTKAISWPSFWEGGKPRHFLAAMIDVGLLYFRPRLSAGYGKPFHSWIGLEANPLFSSEGVGAWAGIRAAMPFGDIRIGSRYRYAFRRSFLKPKDAYKREDIEERNGPHSSYVSLEIELTSYLQLGPGTFVSEVALTDVQGVDDGYHVYEETIRVVLDPPFVWRARAGYALEVWAKGGLQIGVVLELVGVPGRRDLIVYRGGVIARLKLYKQLEARGTFIPVLYSRDSLGAAGADTFLIGLRYRWASGLTTYN